MAAGGSVANVELGPGRLYVAPLGTTEPASCSAALPSAWRAVGYTEDGTVVNIALTQSEVDVAEEIDPIKYVLTKRVGTLALAMAEMTRRNLALSMGSGAAAANDATSYEPPDPGTEVGVMAVWDMMDTPDATNVRWLFRQCKAGGTIAIPRKKAPAKATIATILNLEKPTGLAPFKVFPSSTGLV